MLSLLLHLSKYNYHTFNCAGLKGIVHPKMKILSSFTHPQEVPNLCEFLCSVEQIQNSIYFSLESFNWWHTWMPLNEGFVSFSSHLQMCFPQTIVHTYIHRQTHSHTKPLVQTGKAWKEQACLVNQENDILGHFPHPTWRKPMIHHTTTGAEPSLGSIICHTSPLPASSVVTPSFFFSVLSCSLCLSPSQEGFCRLKKNSKNINMQISTNWNEINPLFCEKKVQSATLIVVAIINSVHCLDQSHVLLCGYEFIPPTNLDAVKRFAL